MCHCSLLLRKLGESVRLANIRTLCCYRIYICFESSSKNYSDLFSQRKNSLLLNLSEIPYPELNRCYYKNCEIVDNFVDKNQHISFISFFLYTQRKIDLVLRSKFYPIIFKIYFQKSLASFLRPRATKIPFQNIKRKPRGKNRTSWLDNNRILWNIVFWQWFVDERSCSVC